MSKPLTQALANRIVYATMYYEAQGMDTAILSQEVNQKISEAIASIKKNPEVEVYTSAPWISPIYTKKQDSTQEKQTSSIESWRMHSSIIVLKSHNIPSISALISKLQSTLKLTSITKQPSKEEQEAAKQQTFKEAIKLFQTQSQIIAQN